MFVIQYSINKTKAVLGLVGHDWQQRIVAEIDSALNGWIDSLPEHRTYEASFEISDISLTINDWSVRWDPHMEDMVFLNQSALLYTSYYTVQITVHRPFIPSPRKPSLLSFPSLAICTNAARSCIHVLDGEWKRTGTASYFHMVFNGIFTPLLTFIDASLSVLSIQRWYCVATQHMGWKTVRTVDRPFKRDAGGTQCYEPSQSDGAKVGSFSPPGNVISPSI